MSLRPVRAKALIELRKILELLPLSGRTLSLITKPKALPWARSFCPFGANIIANNETQGVALGWELLPLEFLQYRLRSAELQASLALLSLARHLAPSGRRLATSCAAVSLSRRALRRRRDDGWVLAAPQFAANFALFDAIVTTAGY